jgi:hypothetical protein
MLRVQTHPFKRSVLRFPPPFLARQDYAPTLACLTGSDTPPVARDDRHFGDNHLFFAAPLILLPKFRKFPSDLSGQTPDGAPGDLVTQDSFGRDFRPFKRTYFRHQMDHGTRQFRSDFPTIHPHGNPLREKKTADICGSKQPFP